MPRLTYEPSVSSEAARAAISSRVQAMSATHVLLLVRRSSARSHGALLDPLVRGLLRASARPRAARRRPGVWTSLGSSSPGSTSSSTSAIVTRPHIAASGLKLRAESRKTRLPCRSPFQARTSPKSATIACSRTNSLSPSAVANVPGLLRRRGDHHVAVGVVLPRQPALGHLGADAGRGEERRDARAAGPHPLGQRALRGQLDLELAGEVLPGELLVLPDVRRHHPAEPLGHQQQAQAPVVDAAVVRHRLEVGRARPPAAPRSAPTGCRTARSRRPPASPRRRCPPPPPRRSPRPCPRLVLLVPGGPAPGSEMLVASRASRSRRRPPHRLADVSPRPRCDPPSGRQTAVATGPRCDAARRHRQGRHRQVHGRRRARAGPGHTGKNVLLCEVEGRQGIARMFDVDPLPYEERRIARGLPRADGAPGAVHALHIDPESALLEYLSMYYKLGRAGKALDRFGVIDFATTIAPGRARRAAHRQGLRGRAAQRPQQDGHRRTTPWCSTLRPPGGSPSSSTSTASSPGWPRSGRSSARPTP